MEIELMPHCCNMDMECSLLAISENDDEISILESIKDDAVCDRCSQKVTKDNFGYAIEFANEFTYYCAPCTSIITSDSNNSIDGLHRINYGDDEKIKPNDHCYWNKDRGIWEEGDEHFKNRIKNELSKNE